MPYLVISRVAGRPNGSSTANKGLRREKLCQFKLSFGPVVQARAEGAAWQAARFSGFKVWLQHVAQKSAEAGSEGGFLGFGGVAVSDAEKATLGEITEALGLPRPL